MEIYKVLYEDIEYTKHEKLFAKLDKAKEFTKDIINNEIKAIKNNKDFRLYTHDEFMKEVKDFTKNKEKFENINLSYPIIKYKLKIFDDEVERTLIYYFYLQEDEGKIEEYEMTVNVRIKKIFVED